MSVYVDEPFVYESEPAGYVGRPRERVRWCHMIADTEPELHTMARQIGLRRQWAQVSGRGVLHYDLVPSKRLLALKYGAIPLSRREFAGKLQALRAPQVTPAPPEPPAPFA